MARLSQTDSIDFGFVAVAAKPDVTGDTPFSVDRVWEAAATVYDPEMPVDIVELGLVYRVDTNEQANGAWHIDIDMLSPPRSAGWETSCAKTSTTPWPLYPASTKSKLDSSSTPDGTPHASPMSPDSNSE